MSEMLEFSHPVKMTEIGHVLSGLTLNANARECRLIAQRLDLLELKSFTVKFDRVVDPEPKVIRLKGDILADLVQKCVVTLEPVAQKLDTSFSWRLALPGYRPRPVEDDEGDFPNDDEPEVITGGVIDLGEIAVEELSLAIDPYPRAPGVEFVEIKEFDEKSEDSRNKPFAKLISVIDGGKIKSEQS